MEQHTWVRSAHELLHDAAAPITSTAYGSVGGSAQTLAYGAGHFARGQYMAMSIINAAVGTGATYQVVFEGRPAGGAYVPLGAWTIPGGTALANWLVPITASYIDGVAMAEFRVQLVLGGTDPELDIKIWVTNNVM